MFVKLLADKGIISFHDANVTPENNYTTYTRLNGSRSNVGAGNPRGVAPAIKEFFGIEFDESKYENIVFQKDGLSWHMIHYPFCNGLTLIQLMGNANK